MFMMYSVRRDGKGEKLSFTGDHYQLAGYGLLHSLWTKKGRPRNVGWHVGADELIREAAKNQFDSSARRLLIDTAPTSKVRVEVIEIQEIHAFTVADQISGVVWYTPLMLSIRGVMNHDIPQDLPKSEREVMVREIANPQYNEGLREFLYLLGDKNGWNWGMSGRTNAAILDPKARDYFRKHF